MHISLINFGQIWKYSYGSIVVFVIWLIFFINWYYLRYFKTFGKAPLSMHLLKSSTIIVANISEYSLMSFFGISLDCEIFLGAKVFDFLDDKGLCYFIETKIRLLYLIHMIFDGRNSRMIFVLFSYWCQRISNRCSNFTHVVCILT